MNYEEWGKSEEGRQILESWVLDPQDILGVQASVEGVYGINVVNANGARIPMYVGQAGKTSGAPAYAAQNVGERLLQHFKAWLANSYVEYWPGLAPEELTDDWKFEIELLKKETNQKKRLLLETKFVKERKPFLQMCDGRYRKYYSKSGYARNDLCIHPWGGQRRAAFVNRVESLEFENI